MNRRIFNFELNGKTVLGFDTGLDAKSFAQAKMARLIANPGIIVYPNGETKSWQPEGVAEQDTMIIWGPCFPGEELSDLINENSRREEAMDSLRFWLRAMLVIEGKSEDKAGGEKPFPGPAGALIVTAKPASPNTDDNYPEGTVFFPPSRLLRRTLEAGGAGTVLEAERWIHPGLEGADRISFSTGAMLYGIFSGAPPFPRDDPSLTELRQDMNEAIFIPPNLAAPGIDPEMAALIGRSLSRIAQNSEERNRPSPDVLSLFIGAPGSKTVSSWQRRLNEEEISKIRAEQEQYIKKSTLKVKTRRFVIRKSAIITGVAVAVIAVILLVRGFVQHRAEMPNTKGMDPSGVAEAYYSAFSSLDHPMMEACVTNKAGKDDINLVMHLFVISRVRQAYEIGQVSFMSALEWMDAGRPETNTIVFGITDLKVKVISGNGREAVLEANYILWMPESYSPDQNAVSSGTGSAQEEEEDIMQVIVGRPTSDRLSLVYNKDAWLIREIVRNY